MELEDIRWCSKCWTPSTRPRITFNEKGVCNACQHSEAKKAINWRERQDFLRAICDSYRKGGGELDCIVPWSGGKDSIYVAYKMRDEFGMTPLLVIVMPHLETDIGEWNRKNTCPGFEKMEISLKTDKYRSLAKKYFIEQGRPKHPWETAISAVVINQAWQMDIPFIVYGEEGEQEYGGSSREADRWKLPVDKDYLMQFYLQDKLDWEIPPDEELEKIFFTQYSRFENWSPSRHADFAINKGMRSKPVRSVGTFTMWSQISDYMQDLHSYLMMLKFGFGRCTADVAIAIREGWKSRSEGLELIEAYDGEFPNQLLDRYLEYFDMDYPTFCRTLAGHTNKELLEPAESMRDDHAIPQNWEGAKTSHGAAHIWYLQAWAAKHRRRDTKNELTSPERFDVR